MVSTIFSQGKAKTSDKTNKNSHEALSRIVPLLPLQDTLSTKKSHFHGTAWETPLHSYATPRTSSNATEVSGC